MAAPVNTGQLIYCSELILAHQKTFTELTSLIMIGMKLKIIKAPIYVKTPFNLCKRFCAVYQEQRMRNKSQRPREK